MNINELLAMYEDVVSMADFKAKKSGEKFSGAWYVHHHRRTGNGKNYNNQYVDNNSAGSRAENRGGGTYGKSGKEDNRSHGKGCDDSASSAGILL